MDEKQYFASFSNNLYRARSQRRRNSNCRQCQYHWIGEWLFSSTSITDEKDNLVVILTPYVIDKSEKLSQLQKELGQLANLQREYNLEVFQRIEEEGFDSSSELTVDLDEEVEAEKKDTIDTSNLIQEAEDLEGIE